VQNLANSSSALADLALARRLLGIAIKRGTMPDGFEIDHIGKKRLASRPVGAIDEAAA
jgi:hypothetical protein